MQKASSSADKWLIHYAHSIIRFRWLVLLISLVTVTALGWGLQYLSLNTDFRYFFGKENPQLIAFDNMEDTYNKTDAIVFVFKHESDDIFSPAMIKMQQQFTEQAWELIYSKRVDSITNFQRMQADGDDLLVDNLIPDEIELSPEFIASAREYALSEPILNNRLLNDSLSHVAINVVYELPGESAAEVPNAVAEARALVEETKANYPGLSVYLTGGMMINNAFSEAARADVASFIPAMFVIILLAVFIMTNSISGTLSTFLIVIFSTICAMGIAGYLQTQLTPPSMTSPILIMTLAIADCIHVLLTVLVNMRQGISKQESIVESIRLNFMPVLITSVTTALGFLTINFSDSPPLHDLGNIVAMGVIAAFLFSISCFPALLAILPLRTKASANRLTTSMERLSEWVIAQRTPLLIVMSLVCFGLSALTPLNQGNDSFVEYFDETIQFRTDTDYISEHLTGMYALMFSFDSKEENGIASPDYLAKLEDIRAWFEAKPFVTHISTVTDVFKNLNKNMNGGDERFYTIPESKSLAAQYLLLYEMSLPYGLDLNNQISLDKSASKFVVTIENLDAITTRALIDEVLIWLDANHPELKTLPISPNIMFSYISERNINSMVVGMICALIGISLLMIVALRSVSIGLLSLIPNLIPMGMAFGLWGLFVGEINFTMAVVMGMTLGIVVDDTVHFLSKYLRARREQGLDSADSIRYAFKHVGGALFTMSVVLIAGFAVLANSHFLANSGMSKLTMIAIACALIADFFLLPPLLMLFDKKSRTHQAIH